MYAYLSGKLTYKSPTQVYLECAGVGYQVNITLFTFSDVEREEEAKLFTYLHVREDALLLYGFSTVVERDMFMLLIGVSGVGTNTARLILSSMTTNDLARAIINEEVSLIQTIKGIGPKSAKRLVLELKDKVGSMNTGETVEVVTGTGEQTIEEAVAALTMLGFAKPQSEKAIRNVWQSNPAASVEELIKLSLKKL
ncbi:MAG: Holliday junction branch migration protein RuvA [Bacteroidetes bacterium]|nr:Holliday junction branch migration protein RuvA [Bacteroidota bacterium]